jgi:hypothetical protein
MASYMDAVEGKHTDGREQGIAMSKEDLIDLVIDQMLKDIENGDFTAIQELLITVPETNLKSFLSEGPY